MNNYLDSWVEVLKSTEITAIEQINSNKTYFKEILNHRLFVQNMKYSDQNVKIHFNGELIANIVGKSKLVNECKSINYKKFVQHDSLYFWTYPNDGTKSKTTEPVLAVPFKGELKAYLIIDGNHRIAEAIKKKEDIKLILLPTNDEDFNLYLFTSVFDQMFYYFLWDIHSLNIYRNENPTIVDTEILEKSYLKTFKMMDMF